MISLELPFRRALVLGLGASGRAAARLLLAAGVETRGYDQKPALADLPVGLQAFLGTPLAPDLAWAGIDLLVLSPGVPPEPHRHAQRRLAPQAAVHGELGLALGVAAAAWPPTPTVLVTGTNGKSTVTALTAALLSAGGCRPFAGGNLGPPLADLVLDVARGAPRPDALVLECSSYQLETLPAAPADVAMLLNLAPDHLARYSTLDAYARAKARVFAGLRPTGLALLDARDPATPALRPEGRFSVRLVDGDAPPRVEAEALALDAAERYPRARLPLAGHHNAKNALFALCAARHLGVAREACEAGLFGFAGLAHRMQLVGERGGIAFYDDSKATNVAAVLAGLRDFPRPFVLIAGGEPKGEPLGPLRELLATGARGLVALGEAADAFLELAAGIVPSARATDMADAVVRAAALARPGDAVVLSPACASFDMFESFAHRGRAFAEAVAALPSPRA